MLARCKGVTFQTGSSLRVCRKSPWRSIPRSRWCRSLVLVSNRHAFYSSTAASSSEWTNALSSSESMQQNFVLTAAVDELNSEVSEICFDVVNGSVSKRCCRYELCTEITVAYMQYTSRLPAPLYGKILYSACNAVTLNIHTMCYRMFG